MAAEDLLRVWQAMVEREDVDETNTAIIGASIGANMALVTAANEAEIDTVVLLSPGLDYFGVTTDELRSWNNLAKNGHIRPGDQLKVHYR